MSVQLVQLIALLKTIDFSSHVITHLHFARLHEFNQICEEHIAIALTELPHVIRDLAGIVLDDKASAENAEVLTAW